MAEWDAALNTGNILSDGSRTEMRAPVELSNGTSDPYEFGWQVDTVKGRRPVHHRGGGPGVGSKFARFIDERLSIIVLTNLDDVDVDSIVGGAAKIYLKE